MNQPGSSLHAHGIYEQALAFLDTLDVSAMKLGLDRIRKLLATLGNPQDQLPMVHIAGTNGKGSVTAMLTSILKSAGYKVGVFTSPHLIQVRERIAINGSPILPDDFHYEIESLKAHLESLSWPREDWPTYFEFLNVLAYQYFRQKQVDISVFETGLGGRLDSTNVVSQPNLTVITTIGLDHTQHLGDTLAAIAGEKAGILKQGVPLVCGAGIPPEAREVILAKARQLEAPAIVSQPELLTVEPGSNPQEGLLISDAETRTSYRLSLLGPYQKENLAIVMACVGQLRAQGFKIGEAAVEEGLRRTYWPVRFQYFAKEHLILDGSHNADGFQSLTESLKLYFPAEPKLWLVSLRNNRPMEALVQLMAENGPILGAVMTQASPNHLFHSPEVLSQALQSNLGKDFPIVTATNPTEGFQRLKSIRASLPLPHPLCLVTGSLYTAGEILGNLEAH